MLFHGRTARAAVIGLWCSVVMAGPVMADPVPPAAPVAPGEQPDGGPNPEEIFERADRLEQESGKHLTRSELPKAITALRSANECRTPLLGADHWGVRTAALQVKALEGLQSLPAAKRDAAVSALAKWESAAREFEPSQGSAPLTGLAQCCDGLCRTLGDGSILTARARIHLAELQTGAGRSAEARLTAGAVNAQTEKLLGKNHPWYAFSLSLMATADGQLGQWDAARKEAALALRANEHLWGEDTPPCGMNYLTLAWVDINRRDFEAARRHADNALYALAEAKEQDPANYALAKAHLAHALSELGKTEDARKEYISLVSYCDEQEGVPGALERDICHRYVELLSRVGSEQDRKVIEERIARLPKSDETVVR